MFEMIKILIVFERKKPCEFQKMKKRLFLVEKSKRNYISKKVVKHTFLLLGNFNVFAASFGFLEDFINLLVDFFLDFFLKKNIFKNFII